MDTSEVYIKMSFKSPLQELWQPSEWDYIYCKIEKQVVILSGYETDSGYYGHGINCLECHRDPEYWRADHFCLFRQDQLQAMIDLDKHDYLKHYSGESVATQLLRVFIDTISEYDMGLYFNEYFSGFGSMEQLWHAFVVFEKYDKRVWKGEDWV